MIFITCGSRIERVVQPCFITLISSCLNKQTPTSVRKNNSADDKTNSEFMIDPFLCTWVLSLLFGSSFSLFFDFSSKLWRKRKKFGSTNFSFLRHKLSKSRKVGCWRFFHGRKKVVRGYSKEKAKGLMQSWRLRASSNRNSLFKSLWMTLNHQECNSVW